MAGFGAYEQPEGLAASGVGSSGGNSLLISEADFDNDREAVQFVEEWLREQKNKKVNLDRNYFENIEMLAGNQWAIWDDIEQRFKAQVHLQHRVRYVGNLIGTYVTTRAAKLLRNRPFIQVHPATNEPEDFEIASLSTRIMRWVWDSLNIQGHLLPEFIQTLLVFGTSCLKVYYDPHAGTKIDIDKREHESMQKLGDEFVDYVPSVNIGELKWESVAPWWIYPDDSSDSFEDVTVILDTRRRDLDWIRHTYKNGREVISESEEGTHDYYQSRVKDLFGDSSFNAGTGGSSHSPGRPSAIVKDLWVKPCPSYPDGYHLTTAGKVVLQRGPMPEWCNGNLPYFFVVDKKIPGRLWGQATMDDLKPINKIRNRAISQIIENANLSGNPPLLIPVGSRVQPQSVQNRPGERIPYVPTAGGEPKFLEPPRLADFVKNLPERLEADFMLIGGLNEPTLQGKAPENVRTSSGLAALIKEDESRLAVVTEHMNACLSQAGSMSLSIIAKLYTEERLARIAGDKGRFEVVRFQGKDLMGQAEGTPGANYTDVEIRVESGHRSKTAQQEFLLNAAQMGLIRLDSEDERRWLLRTMDIGAPDDAVFGDLRVIEAQARIEERMLSQATDEEFLMAMNVGIMGPHPWDDDMVHLQSHTDFMRRGDFLKLPPDRWLRFQQHVNEHQAAISEKEQKAAMGVPTGDPNIMGSAASLPPSAPPPTQGGLPQQPGGPPQAPPQLPGPVNGGGGGMGGMNGGGGGGMAMPTVSRQMYSDGQGNTINLNVAIPERQVTMPPVNVNVPERQAMVNLNIPERQSNVNVNVPERQTVVNNTIPEGDVNVDVKVPERKVEVGAQTVHVDVDADKIHKQLAAAQKKIAQSAQDSTRKLEQAQDRVEQIAKSSEKTLAKFGDTVERAVDRSQHLFNEKIAETKKPVIKTVKFKRNKEGVVVSADVKRDDGRDEKVGFDRDKRGRIKEAKVTPKDA